MRPIYVKRSNLSTGFYDSNGWVVIDQYVAPGNVSVTVKLTQRSATTPTGTVTLTFTNDDVFDASLGGSFAQQPWTATPFNASGQWTITGFAGVGTVVVVEAMFAYAPRAVKVNLNVTAGQVDFETQVIQLGVAST